MSINRPWRRRSRSEGTGIAGVWRHRADLNAARKDIIRLKDNQSSIMDECSVLRTQVESMGDNLCRSGLRKKLLDSFLLISF